MIYFFGFGVISSSVGLVALGFSFKSLFYRRIDSLSSGVAASIFSFKFWLLDSAFSKRDKLEGLFLLISLSMLSVEFFKLIRLLFVSFCCNFDFN